MTADLKTFTEVSKNFEALHKGPPQGAPAASDASVSSPPGGQLVQHPSPLAHLVGTIDADYETDLDSTIDVPSGVRMRATFTGGQVEILGKPNPHQGTVRSGGDWILVRRDGIMEFDSRITLAFAEDGAADKPRFLVDVTVRGMADLMNSFPVDGEAAFRAFLRGTVGNHKVHMVGSIRFEVADVEQAGLGESWLPKHLKFDKAKFRGLVQLVRQQYLVTAEVETRPGPYCPALKTHMHIWSVSAQKPIDPDLEKPESEKK